MPKILVVDDDELNRDIFTRRLHRKHFEVVVVENGAQACDRARTELPDLILMDMQMPELDGLEATRLLKADPLTRAIPIIGVSCFASEEGKRSALAAGCDDYETKPVDYGKLFAKVEELLHRKVAP